MKRLLLLSNSTLFGEPFLGWPREHITGFLRDTGKGLLFLPYAAVTFGYDEYAGMVENAFGEMGLEIASIHREKDPAKAIENADAIVIGGGNTFKLIHMICQNGLVEVIRKKVNKGTPYIGWSAGSNVACPSIKTTNDMPIIEPPSFNALGLVDFQINPHYTEATIPNHGGESRDQRIREFVAINPGIKVACLPEGSLLRIDDDGLFFSGNELKIFEQGSATRSFADSTRFSREFIPVTSR